jgi:hypothetical protein
VNIFILFIPIDTASLSHSIEETSTGLSHFTHEYESIDTNTVVNVHEQCNNHRPEKRKLFSDTEYTVANNSKVYKAQVNKYKNNHYLYLSLTVRISFALRKRLLHYLLKNSKNNILPCLQGFYCKYLINI